MNRNKSLVVMLAGLAAFFLTSSRSGASVQEVQTVFVILMENHNWSSIGSSSSAPYINNTLLPIASHAEQYYNQPGLHPSLPNYLWLEAGTNFNVTSDVLPSTGHQSSTNHLVTLLKNAGISWHSYQEDICGCLCPLANTNLYVPRHNPMVYFDDVTNTNNANSAYCIANIRAYSQLAGDLQSNTVARYNYITPNLCNDMHNTTGCATSDSLKNGDTWLSNNLPAILNSQAYSNNGAIFILWDEGAGTSDGPIGMIVLSPLAKGGGYFNAIHYTHSSTLRTLQEIFNVTPLLGGAANATDLSDLFRAQLSVTPGSGLISSGPVGGPFNPGSANYNLSNSAAITLSWAASITTNWLSLSATNGTLAPGSSTTVTVSIDTNANDLVVNSYDGTVTFTNTTNGDGTTTRPVSLTVTSTNAGSFGFFDEFNAFASGNLVGQQGWTQLGGAAASPLQVASGQVMIPGLPINSGDNQDARKSFGSEISAPASGTNRFYYGMSITVTSAPTAPSFFMATTNLVGASNFPNFRFTAKDNGNGTYSFGGRINGQSSYPFVYGGGLNYGSNYTVIVEVNLIAGNANDVMRIFVNPTSANLAAQSAYATATYTSGSATDPPSAGAIVLAQFTNASNGQDGLRIGRLVVADNFATAYNDLLGILPPTASFSGDPTTGPEPLAVTFTDTSTGTITNRFWNFGDNVTTNITTNTVIHTYAAGTYNVVLVATGPGGVNTNTQFNYITAFTAFQYWQVQHFGDTGNPDAAPSADPDADGQDNLSEFLAGTDPTDPASVFRITNILRAGNDVLIIWTTGVGKTNALQRTPGDASGGFTTNNFATIFTVTNNSVSVTNFVDQGAATNFPARYYRVRLVP